MPLHPCCHLALIAVASLPLMAQSPVPGQTAQSFQQTITRTVGADYLLFLPRDYAADTARRWPLLLFLHGAGERGSNLVQVAVHGPPKIVRDRPDFPFIVVSPQCPTGQRWENDVVFALLDQVQATCRVDPERVYLTGLSMGGYGTWSAALAHPERFAAVIPICGGGDPLKLLLPDPAREAALRALPVWAFHGAKDSVVPLIESQRMVDALKRFGCREVEFTVYPDADHDSWSETYANPKLYDWLLRHRRSR